MQRGTATTQTPTNTINSTSQRIYAQLRPSDSDVADIQVIQNNLTYQEQGRLIGSDELHLTLIHFGKSDEVYQTINQHSDVHRERYDELLTDYIAKTKAVMLHETLSLDFDTYDLFGPKKKTLVLKFMPSETLSQLHTKLFALLLDFFEKLTIPEPLDFMANDPNFKHALTCEPHVTLYKGYVGELPKVACKPMKFESMKVIYY